MVRSGTLIDATLATPYNLNPTEFGVDYVLHSATKYLGGHNDLIAGVNFGIPLNEFNRFNFGMAVHQIDFKTGAFPSQEVREFEETEGDNFLDFEVTLNWRHDSRDSAIFPNTGALQSLSTEATVPGSDLSYWKVSYDHRRYWQLTSDLVVSVNAEIGYGDAYGDTTKLPFFENFFSGGPGSVRGYAARSIGPRDSFGDPLGGNAMYAGNLELLFPPPFMKDSDTVRLATFFDFGTVVDTSDTDLFEPDEVRYSVGIGASWLSPVGALTVSYALPLKTDSQDEKEEFQFSFGQTF